MRLGALARWRQEVRDGRRADTVHCFDALHAAACNEAAAIEREAAGDTKRALWFMDCALLRLDGCDGTPGDGRAGDRMLKQLKDRVRAA